jgi:hypothetical protein
VRRIPRRLTATSRARTSPCEWPLSHRFSSAAISGLQGALPQRVAVLTVRVPVLSNLKVEASSLERFGDLSDGRDERGAAHRKVELIGQQTSQPPFLSPLASALFTRRT